MITNNEALPQLGKDILNVSLTELLQNLNLKREDVVVTPILYETRDRTGYPKTLFEPFDYVIAQDRQVTFDVTTFDVTGYIYGYFGLFGIDRPSGRIEGYSRMNVLVIGVSKRGKNPDDVDKYPILKQILQELEEGRNWRKYNYRPVEETEDWRFVHTFIIGAGIDNYDFPELRKRAYKSRINNMLSHVASPSVNSSEMNLYLGFVQKLVKHAGLEEPQQIGELRNKANIKNVEECINAAREAIERAKRARKLGKESMGSAELDSARQFLGFVSDNIRWYELNPDMFKEKIEDVTRELVETKQSIESNHYMKD